MDWPTTIALLAFVASLISLGWQLRRNRWEQPVVIVTGTMARREPEITWLINGTPSAVHLDWTMEVTVVNVGERPVTVLRVHWQDDWPEREPLVFTAPVGPELPLRLEAHDSRTWVFERPDDSAMLPFEPFYPAVTLVRRPLWPRTQSIVTDRGNAVLPWDDLERVGAHRAPTRNRRLVR